MSETPVPTDNRDKPTFGRTKHGLHVHLHAIDHLPTHNAYARFNKRVAIVVTNGVGSMTCAWIFCVLALVSLPAVLSAFAVFQGVFPNWLIKASVIALIAWVAQTFLQLVLLSVIMVGQNVQQAASDARAAKTFEDTEVILNKLDVRYESGLSEVMRAIEALETKVDALARQNRGS